MDFTGDVFIWAAIAVVLAIGMMLFVQWANRRNIKITWYDWLIGLLGLAILLFSIQNFVASYIEDEPQAALMFLLFPGLIGLLLMGVAYGITIRRRRNA